MATTDQYPLVSDGIAAIISAFAANGQTGLVMTRKNLAVFLEGMRSLHEAALLLETMADRERWNHAARNERQAVDRVTLEAAIAAGRVSIFPVIARPTAHNPSGGAA